MCVYVFVVKLHWLLAYIFLIFIAFKAVRGTEKEKSIQGEKITGNISILKFYKTDYEVKSNVLTSLRKDSIFIY